MKKKTKRKIGYRILDRTLDLALGWGWISDLGLGLWLRSGLGWVGLGLVVYA